MQVGVCERIVKLLCDRPGSMVLSRQVGNVKVGEYPNATDDGSVCGGTMSRFFRRMWEAVGNKTRARWRLKAESKALDRNNGGREVVSFVTAERNWHVEFRS
jgi:hypothetical protein